MTGPPVVLIVEDDQLIQDLYRDALEGQVLLLQAFTVAEAREHFKSHQSTLEMIFMDANLLKGEQTFVLTREIRASFDDESMIPMIAISDDPNCQAELLRSGCSQGSTKAEVPDILVKELGLIL